VKSVAITALGLLGAVLAQATLSRWLPSASLYFDPFLLVAVYAGLSGGEVRGMLAGTAAGWVQDVLFGGPVKGLLALGKLLVGFGVGLATSHFLLAGPSARLLVLFFSAVADALVVVWLGHLLGVGVGALSGSGVVLRASLVASLGTAVFELLESRFGRDRSS
jgi:rod shape-determining protein MreD